MQFACPYCKTPVPGWSNLPFGIPWMPCRLSMCLFCWISQTESACWQLAGRNRWLQDCAPKGIWPQFLRRPRQPCPILCTAMESLPCWTVPLARRGTLRWHHWKSICPWHRQICKFPSHGRALPRFPTHERSWRSDVLQHQRLRTMPLNWTSILKTRFWIKFFPGI